MFLFNLMIFKFSLNLLENKLVPKESIFQYLMYNDKYNINKLKKFSTTQNALCTKILQNKIQKNYRIEMLHMEKNIYTDIQIVSKIISLNL